MDNAIKESNNHQTKTDQNLTYDNRSPQIGDLSLHGHAQLQEVDVQSPCRTTDGPLPWWRREDTRLQLESWQCCPGGGCTERARGRPAGGSGPVGAAVNRHFVSAKSRSAPAMTRTPAKEPANFTAARTSSHAPAPQRSPSLIRHQ